MNYGELINKTLRIGSSGDVEAVKDCLQIIKNLEREGSVVLYDDGREVLVHNPENFKAAHEVVKDCRAVASQLVKSVGGKAALDVYWACHLFDAPYEFDSYCLYLEHKREPRKQFYLPRRKQLLPIVQALQDLSDDKISMLGISLPPGVGKTTLAEFFLTFEAGRHPELPNLTGSHNNAFLAGLYGELLRIFDPDGEYCWNDVFPRLCVANTNAKDMLIDIAIDKHHSKRFATLEFTSVGSGNAGKVRAMNLLYCDDLVDGIETAMSRDRLDKLYQQYYTDLRQRKIGDRVKELHIATRWSINDVIGRLESQYEKDDSARFIRIPALNADDESNFDYPYGLGYTTKMLHEQRDIMDDASWKALYQNEPIEREGQLYAPEEMRYYFDLPEQESDAIIAVCDTKEQGDDYCVMPVVYQYGADFYVDKFICDNGKPNVIEKRIVELLLDRNVQMARFESNRGGTVFAENVQKSIKERQGRTKITTKWNQTNKDTRIIVNSGWIKDHCLFRSESVRDKEYRTAMNFLIGYTMTGKNKHDDVPDAMADLADFAQSSRMTTVEVLKRFW